MMIIFNYKQEYSTKQTTKEGKIVKGNDEIDKELSKTILKSGKLYNTVKEWIRREKENNEEYKNKSN